MGGLLCEFCNDFTLAHRDAVGSRPPHHRRNGRREIERGHVVSRNNFLRTATNAVQKSGLGTISQHSKNLRPQERRINQRFFNLLRPKYNPCPVFSELRVIAGCHAILQPDHIPVVQGWHSERDVAPIVVRSRRVDQPLRLAMLLIRTGQIEVA